MSLAWMCANSPSENGSGVRFKSWTTSTPGRAATSRFTQPALMSVPHPKFSDFTNDPLVLEREIIYPMEARKCNASTMEGGIELGCQESVTVVLFLAVSMVQS